MVRLVSDYGLIAYLREQVPFPSFPGVLRSGLLEDLVGGCPHLALSAGAGAAAVPSLEPEVRRMRRMRRKRRKRRKRRMRNMLSHELERTLWKDVTRCFSKRLLPQA